LRGQREAAPLDEAAVVDEIGDVLARRPLSALAPALDGRRSRGVGRGRKTRAQLG
jgi:hypothetical protein